MKSLYDAVESKETVEVIYHLMIFVKRSPPLAISFLRAIVVTWANN